MALGISPQDRREAACCRRHPSSSSACQLRNERMDLELHGTHAVGCDEVILSKERAVSEQ